MVLRDLLVIIYLGWNNVMIDEIRIFFLALKFYWMEGEDWDEAVEFAKVIVNRWKT